MKACCRLHRSRSTRNSGFTLTEVLVATALTLLMMAVAVNGFGLMAGSISNNRAVIEASGRLRDAQQRLQLDLKYITARTIPPLDPKDELGYLEIIEGPGPWVPGFSVGAQPVNDLGNFDSSVGDVDDIIMFTTRSAGDPFTGAWQGNPVQSQVAEVAWFMRGNKLYRRQLLVLPALGSQLLPSNYYNVNDVSVRREGGQRDHRTAYASRASVVTANSLGDLTKRENRFAHQPLQFPHDVRYWGQLGLPLMQETTDDAFPLLEGGSAQDVFIQIDGWTSTASGFPYRNTRDYWLNPMAGFAVTPDPMVPNDARPSDALRTLADGGRATEDLILNNVIGFDIKVWDPGAPVFEQGGQPILPGDIAYKHKLKDGGTQIGTGAFVDLFYTRGVTVHPSVTVGPFADRGHTKSGLSASGNMPAVYCTWSTHYENDGRNQADYLKDADDNPIVLTDEGTDGVGSDALEYETLPPYPVPLRAIQVKIRVFEPDSGQIREVTVVQDFIR